MNCLNRYEIQRYIDKEVSEHEMEEFEKHLENCHTCRSLYTYVKEDIVKINQLLSDNELSDDEITVPKFNYPLRKLTTRAWIIRVSVAASLLLPFGIYLTFNYYSSKSRQINKSELEVEQLLYQSDPNKLWSDKQPIITITDDKGEIIYSNINN